VCLTPKRGIGLVILEIAMEHHQIFIDSLLLLLSINGPFFHRVPEGRSSDIMIFISKSNMEKNANPQCFFLMKQETGCKSGTTTAGMDCSLIHIDCTIDGQTAKT
jgi:hypothetical protein